ncbi:1-pyrroline-5-carboxylate dehydrogenase [Paraburkholderia tropica]|uniref:1-pyrroline-5-carboxylate dehydrogenase n=1 Tax=Paraburkholderia tropica TaxID=92647 RepID=UPI001F329F07|nr:1-pyrroline-5-carboxylate dehydrogenase [Paraburkholderia tropica]
MREDIIKYLSTVQQSTAKSIASRIGIDSLDVARELNHMLNDGLVEREKKQGAGNEYYYWISRVDRSVEEPAQPPVDETKPETTPVAVAATDVLERQIVTLQNQIVDLNARRDSDAAKCLAVETERDEFKVENESLKQTVGKLRENTAALERRIDELTIIDAEFKPSQLFVTVGRYSKPMRHDTLEKAQKRGNSLVRTEKESEVLVCEPIGRVVRGSEWRGR